MKYGDVKVGDDFVFSRREGKYKSICSVIKVTETQFTLSNRIRVMKSTGNIVNDGIWSNRSVYRATTKFKNQVNDEVKLRSLKLDAEGLLEKLFSNMKKAEVADIDRLQKLIGKLKNISL